MNRIEFLKELTNQLSILNDSEQNDILNEYIQHIDMKMKDGMSEDEAIKDFGDINELASDILEAYHVNPQYSEGHKSAIKTPPKIKKPDLSKLSKTVQGGSLGFLHWIKSIGRHIKSFLLTIILFICKPFKNSKKFYNERKTAHISRKEGRELKPHAPSSHDVLSYKIKYFFNNLFSRILFFILWCIRWAWNCFWFFSGLFISLFGLGCLFAFGTVLVLTFQGYPLIGVTLACLGAVLCTGALTAFCLSRLKLKRTTTIIQQEAKGDLE